MKTDKTKTEKQITAEDVRIAAGLEEPWTFALEAMRRNLSDERVADLGDIAAVARVRVGTGRTTRILCRAAAMVLQGRAVRVVKADHPGGLDAAALTGRAALWAGRATRDVLGAPAVVSTVWLESGPVAALNGARVDSVIELQDHGEQDV